MTDIMSVHVFAESATPATAEQINEQAKNSQSTVYVFYSHPSVYVAHGLEQGRSSSDLCDEWLAGLNEAIEGQRKSRRIVRLLCLQDALDQPNGLSDQTGLNRGQLDEFRVLPDSLALMAGHQLALQNDNISKIMERLEALTMHLSDKVYRVTIDAEKILKEFNDSEAHASATSEELAQAKNTLQKNQEENEQLLAQLHQVQQQLENYFIKYQDSEKQRVQERLINKKTQQFEINKKLLAEKDAEIEHLNQRLTALQVNSSNGGYDSASQTTASSKETQKAPRQSLSARIKKRLKFRRGEAGDKKAWIKAKSTQLQESEYFDSEWYLTKYPDLKEAGVNPAEHYLRFGGFESRDPSPKFNSAFYLKQNPDVAKEGINPLLHFVLYGKAEGRLPKPKSSTNTGANE